MRYVSRSALALLLLAAGFLVTLHTGTRVAVYLNFRLWLPSSAHKIKIVEARSFTGMDGLDGSVAHFTIPRRDFDVFISRQPWCNRCYAQGPFMTMPDSLRGKYPMKETEFKALVGDVLLMHADTIGADLLEVRMSVDWN